MFSTNLYTLVLLAAGLSVSAAPASVKRSDASPALVARQINATLPNQPPVEGVLPFNITLPPGAQNSTIGLPPGFPFKARQSNATVSKELPVEGVLPFNITLTPGAQKTTVGLPSGFPFKFKRDDNHEDDGQLNFTLSNKLPIEGSLPFVNVSSGAQNSTVALPAGFPFKRDASSTPHCPTNLHRMSTVLALL